MLACYCCYGILFCFAIITWKLLSKCSSNCTALRRHRQVMLTLSSAAKKCKENSGSTQFLKIARLSARTSQCLLLKVAAHAHAEQLRPRNAWKIQFLLIPPRQAFNWALSDSIPVDWLSRLILATQSDDFEWWKTSSSTVVNNQRAGSKFHEKKL